MGLQHLPHLTKRKLVLCGIATLRGYDKGLEETLDIAERYVEGLVNDIEMQKAVHKAYSLDFVMPNKLTAATYHIAVAAFSYDVVHSVYQVQAAFYLMNEPHNNKFIIDIFGTPSS